jgi:hypothetical protein
VVIDLSDIKMDKLPVEIILTGIVYNLPLVDIISLRGTCQYLRWVISNRELIRIFSCRLFEDHAMAKLFWEVHLKKEDPDYHLKKVLHYLSKNQEPSLIFDFLSLTIKETKQELDIYYDSCHYFNAGYPHHLPHGLHKSSGKIFHQDGRRVLFLNEKHHFLRKLYERGGSPDHAYYRGVLPYFIGLSQREVVEYWKYRRDHGDEVQEDLIPIEYSGEEQLYYPEIITDGYWCLVYPKSKLYTKWNLVMEKFQRKLLPVKAVGVKSKRVFSGKIILAGPEDDEIGQQIIDVLEYQECDSVTYFSTKEVKRLFTHRKQKSIICSEKP